MALHEIPETAAEVITANETRRIRRDFIRMGRDIQRGLREIRNSVALAGKANVSAQLGSDAAAMLTAFNAARALADIILESTEPDVDGN
jgi:hypothetical protein